MAAEPDVHAAAARLLAGLGLHSTHPEYLRVRRLGLYNARSDTMWSVPVARIGADAVRAVERDVIGYADGL